MYSFEKWAGIVFTTVHFSKENNLTTFKLGLLIMLGKKDNFSNEELEDMVDLFKNKKSRKLEF